MNIKLFVEKHLINSNGKLESQRLKESWFIKNGFINEFNYFIDNDILSTVNLYKHINNETEFCECGNIRRFVGFKDGFKQYCEKCARTKNNGMKNLSSLVINDFLEVIDFVKDKKGNYSSTKIKRLAKITIQNIINRTNYLDKETSLGERLYHIENNLFGLPKCKLCGKEHNNFKFSTKGYFDYCKGKCSYAYNSDDRKNGLKKHFYTKYKEQFSNVANYEIKLFSLENYINDENCDIRFTHITCGHFYVRNKNYQGHYRCPKCYPIRSKVQYDIFNWLLGHTYCSMNDRQLIKPKEVDILCKNFGIEYDSLMFHSYGKSNFDPLQNTIENKNIHLEKTELCEENGIQLFRIFSNEWHDKQDIWKSIILNKIGRNDRIFARKCYIKEIDSKTANDFLDKNHIQGKASQSIRIGLYYNNGIKNELVSLMTFGKSRYNKKVEYELIRFCTKLNTVVVGGASRLLKYFETKYKPKSIISYANRRWSQGNLYETLGFEYSHSTLPNYFYFNSKDGDSATLHSREQFQKHKLKIKLKTFNPNLTETENMFNNGYRKIYDCGNKVYMKYYN